MRSPQVSRFSKMSFKPLLLLTDSLQPAIIGAFSSPKNKTQQKAIVRVIIRPHRPVQVPTSSESHALIRIRALTQIIFVKGKTFSWNNNEMINN